MHAVEPAEPDAYPQLADVRRLLAVAHPTFPGRTLERLVEGIASDHRYLAGTDLHAVAVHDEAERQLAYLDGDGRGSVPRRR